MQRDHRKWVHSSRSRNRQCTKSLYISTGAVKETNDDDEEVTEVATKEVDDNNTGERKECPKWRQTAIKIQPRQSNKLPPIRRSRLVIRIAVIRD